MASNVGKEANDEDRISKLPHSILSLILSSLSIKDAVSTSILSTRWQLLFASMFNLDVDFHLFRSCPPPYTVKSFTNFMEEMLFFHTEVRIEQFRLNHIVLFFHKKCLVLLEPKLAFLDRPCGFFCIPKKEERDAVVERFEGIDNVKSLHLIVESETLPFLSHKRFALQNLLHLYIFDRSKNWQGDGFLEFLEFTPNLQTLVMYDVSSEVLFQTENVPPCLLYQLKEFKVFNFKDVSSLFKLVSYILKNTIVLEKLQIFKPSLLKAEEKFEIANHLLSFPRSSNKYEVRTFFI